MVDEPENQDWRKFGEGGKNRWNQKNEIKNTSQSTHKSKQ
jgi:hypothetical protein|tara:strand:- start:79 stop:198 length:120 start_codon:yes stop_codon:yes gene_type:complete